MNYILEIKRFYDRQLSEHLPAGQIALWHALMELNNRTGWQEWFAAPIDALALLAGLSKPTVYKNLKNLCELSYIKIDKNFIKILTNPDKNTPPHLINNKTKLNETKQNERKDDFYDEPASSARAPERAAAPGGIKL